MAWPFRAGVPRVDHAGARRRPAAALQAPMFVDDPERRALVVGPTRDDHWSPDQISGRITMERPDLAVSGESIYRAVHSGSSDCELPRHRKASMPLGQPDGLLRAQGQSAPGRRGTTRRAGRPPSTSAVPTTLGSAGPARTRTGSAGTGSRKARASTVPPTKSKRAYDSLNRRPAQASGVEMPLVGLPSSVVALALRIRREIRKAANPF